METDSQRILSWGRMGYVLFVLSRSNAHQFLKFLQRFHLAQIIAAITGWSKMSWCFLEFFRKAPKYSSSGTGGEVPFLSLLDCNVGSWSKRPSPSANGSEMPLSNRILLLFFIAKESPKEWAPGSVNLVPALAYHFCLASPPKITQPGAHSYWQPLRCIKPMLVCTIYPGGTSDFISKFITNPDSDGAPSNCTQLSRYSRSMEVSMPSTEIKTLYKHFVRTPQVVCRSQHLFTRHDSTYVGIE